MEECSASEEWARLVAEFDELGGVAEFALFRPPPGAPVTLSHHREAALDTIRAAERKVQEWQKKAGVRPEDWVRYTLEPGKMTARRIDFREFLGPWCDADRKTLRGAADEPTGFAYAFSHPPYDMSSPTRVQKLFTAVLDSLFGDRADLELHEWSTDWSSYFEAGHDWWGSFCWTVWVPRKNHLVGIAASSTD